MKKTMLEFFEQLINYDDNGPNYIELTNDTMKKDTTILLRRKLNRPDGGRWLSDIYHSTDNIILHNMINKSKYTLSCYKFQYIRDDGEENFYSWFYEPIDLVLLTEWEEIK